MAKFGVINIERTYEELKVHQYGYIIAYYSDFVPSSEELMFNRTPEASQGEGFKTFFMSNFYQKMWCNMGKMAYSICQNGLLNDSEYGL